MLFFKLQELSNFFSILGMIDTHAHLYSDKLKPDLAEVISRAKMAGISKILLPNIDESSVEPMLALKKQEPELVDIMLGLHPCSVTIAYKNQLAALEPLFATENAVAVGEMGLDYYWDKSLIAEQKAAFKIQAAWAIERQLPLVIHSRDAMDDVIKLLQNLQQGSLTGVLHCFTGTLEQAQKLLDLNFYLGIGGVATYKNGGLDEVVPHLPQNKLLLETDCPYLAPVPKRGKRNEPAYVAHVAEKIAPWLKLSTADLVKLTSDNAKKLFKL